MSIVTGVEFFIELRSMSFDFGAITLTLVHALLTWALVEEIIYRGHLYKKVKNITNSMWATIIITSLIFSANHIFAFDNLHIFLPMAFIFGLLCCICREKIKHCSLLSLIIAHSVNNMLQDIVHIILIFCSIAQTFGDYANKLGIAYFHPLR
jgi:membrane protease YdiL (CAAX protease family)